MNKAVFLDRDGTIIPDRGYLDNVEGIYLSPENAKALAALCEQGFLLVVITNQSGVGRGYFPEITVREQHQRLMALGKSYGVHFSGLAYCPHTPEAGCDCRKPSPKLIFSEGKRLDIDLSQSFMIGDKLSDIRAGHRAGCTTIMIAATPEQEADFTVRTLPAAAEIILKKSIISAQRRHAGVGSFGA